METTVKTDYAQVREQLSALEQVQRATLNILEDFDAERKRLEQGQRATLNILEDFNDERKRLEQGQRATLNILEDFNAEKDMLGQSQRALLNILEDFEAEKAKVEVANLSLEAANKELEAFTYSVSHDLRAPLRHIDGFSKLLVEEQAAALPPAAQEYISVIRSSTREMGQLVDDLLNLARVGRRELDLQATGLSSIVAEVVNELKRVITDRSIDWKIQELPFVECDASLMKQVFTNLFSNAVKFTRPRERAIIEVGTIENNGQATVFVRDNGVGFSMKHADKLFRAFQRLHRQEDFEGTGVGLATIQRIIQKHGGRVWAQSELNKGATFYFTLMPPKDTGTEAHAAAVGEATNAGNI